MLSIHPVEISETASSGSWSANTQKISGGLLRQIYIKANSSDTTFDFKLTDDKDNVVYSTLVKGTTATGTLNVLLTLPMRGIYTMAVSNASTDEAFTGRLSITER